MSNLPRLRARRGRCPGADAALAGFVLAHPLQITISTGYDRDEKLPRYAHASIAEAWLVDVNNDTVEQYLQPRNGKYLLKKLVERGDTLVAQSIAGLQLDTDRIFE